ncbi:hypothetical protein KEM48_007763 [Puccinia striiformis f. sp. tritici PST-130]|nr:hypothetical protein KEM48_007763 [Puccinia striiformis f. sp. tritici PST-130]
MTQMIWNGLKNGLGSIKSTNQPSITARSGSLGSALGQTESFSTTGIMLIKTKKQKKEIERQRMPKAYLSWENCELAQLIVKKEDVWAGKINPVPVLLNQDQKKPSKKNPSSSTTTTTDNTATQDNNQSLVLNFGLDENEHQKAILFDGLPKIKELLKIKNKPILIPVISLHPLHRIQKKRPQRWAQKRMKKILRNYVRRMTGSWIYVILIQKESINLSNLDKAFSPKDPINPEKLDPCCSEVQTAMLTYRIHTVLDDAWQNRRDKDSKRHLSDLVMKRMKILKYLKRVNPSSYFKLLPRIGLQPKYLKDELIVRAKLPLRPGESLD